MKARVAIMALLLLAGAVMRPAGAGNLLSNGEFKVKSFSVERVGPEEKEPLPEIKAVESNLFVNPDFKENEDGKMKAWTTWGTDKNTTIERVMIDGRAQFVYSSPVLSWACFIQTIEDIEGGKTYVFSMTHRESEGFNWNMAVKVSQHYQDQTLRTDYISSAIPPVCAWTTWSGEIKLEPKTDRVSVIVHPRGIGQASFAHISLEKK
ncbi:MAG: carbohydrate binding domain-containing protein [Verrucomicrobiota bacterium]